MAIRHLMSDPVTVLTPCKNGRLWLRYSTGRLAEVEVTELIADGGFKEINKTIAAIDSTWDYRDFDSQHWHLQNTTA